MLEVQRVGLIGCGRMGRAMALHLLAAGWPVTATDVDPAARDRVVESGAVGAASAREVAEASDLVLTVVVDDAQVRDALAGPDGALAGTRPGTVVAICASVRPDTCTELALAGDEGGSHVIDVALVRGERGAEAGRLLLYCGGPGDVIDACRPAFSAFATDVVVVGGVGAGQIAKAANNVLLWACIRADLEALRLGRALGVEPSVLRGVLSLGSGANRVLDEWGQHRLRWPGKDLETAAALAEEAGVDVPLIRALGPLMEELSVADLHELT